MIEVRAGDQPVTKMLGKLKDILGEDQTDDSDSFHGVAPLECALEGRTALLRKPSLSTASLHHANRLDHYWRYFLSSDRTFRAFRRN
jgi:hypothetical protein